MASESIPETPHYVRKYPGATLLSLDGGGVKGISSLLILQKIMDRVKEIENRELDRERLPKDYFDLAGGTSTGGLAVLMLFRLGMSTTSCISQYRELSAKVFAPTIKGYEIHKLPFGYSLGNFWLWVKRFRKASAFSAPRLESAIEKVLRDPHRGEFQCTGDTLLRDESGKSGRMLMCATVANKGETVLFRSYKPPVDSQPQSETAKQIKHELITIKEACRATSAAPTYLPEMVIQKIRFWDGGLLNNNPVDQVWDARYDLPEARSVDDQGTVKYVEPSVSSVVSIGTSYFKKLETSPSRNLIGIVLRTLGFATNTEAKHWDFEGNNDRRNRRIDSEEERTHYFRYNADVTKDINLDDYQQMGVLAADTETYLAKLEKDRDSSGDSYIDRCAKRLAKTELVNHGNDAEDDAMGGAAAGTV